MNPTWQSGDVTLYLGDCLEVLPTLAAGSVDAVVTDPPYGMGKDFNNGSDRQEAALWLLQSAMPHMTRTLRMGGMAAVFSGTRLVNRTIQMAELAGLTFQRLLWLYKPNDCTYPWRGWLLTSEAIPLFSRGRPDKWTLDNYHHDCYLFNHTTGELPKDTHHPSVKPLEVVRDIVDSSGTERIWSAYSTK